MGDDGFERKLVNHVKHEISTLHAYRRKQHRFSSQDIDILVDSEDSKHYLGIECKSIQTKKQSSKIYFSKAFSEDKDGVHQIERINDFLEKTGRKGYLAVAYRRGRGKTVQWYAINWKYLYHQYEKETVKGLTKKELEENGFRIDKKPKKLLSTSE